MGGMRSTLPFLLIATLAHQTIASKCAPGCVGNSGDVFSYQPGSVYSYELEGESLMSVAGAEGDVAKMIVKATADVTALSNCGFSVSLTSFHISDKGGKSVEGNKGRPVLFSMNNGAVESDICSAKDEPNDALNLKKAVISLLQSSSETKHKTEVDIFGTCPTETDVHKSGSKLMVKKVKNLISCSHRENLMIPFASTHYHSMSDLQSIPWMSAVQKVEQEIEGQVQWAKSTEEYIMPPAAGSEAGTTVTINTKISLKSTGGGAAMPAGIEKEGTIVLKVEDTTGEYSSKWAEETLQDLCKGAQGKVDKFNPIFYAFHTFLISHSTKADILALYNQIKQGKICDDQETAKSILFDAILDSHSAGGVQAMVELLKNKEISGLKARMWYASLGNIKHATIASIKSISALIDGDAPKQAYLGAGGLIGSYCRSHTCEGVPEVNQLQKKLSAPLTKGCKAPSIAEEDKLLASIKGLGNSGYLSGHVTKMLIQCATDHSAKSRVRAASLDALHADPNKENIKKAAIGLLKDKTEDSEIRIKAYLIITECPCGKMAAVIKEVLEKEESFQVGNFIVSHLRNIRASKNPDKAKAKAHFSKILSTKSFPFDIRKYSTNFEQSYMLESLNVGGSVESNVIYSQKSWIPKSVCLNVTSQFFGHSFNLFEMDLRSENLEKMVEKVLGPKGYVAGDSDEISHNMKSFFNSVTNRASQSFRPKRGVSQSEIDDLTKQVNLGADFSEKDESLDISMKMFGSEVAWIPLHGAQLDKTPSETVDSAFELLDGILDKAKNIDFDYTKHKLLAGGMVAYPTAMGVPLKITGVISTAMHVKMDGKVDIPAILRDPKNALVKFQIIPSVSLGAGLATMMEAVGFKTGLKITGVAHTSTGSDITFRVLEGKGIDVKVGLPVNKQELINIETDIHSYTATTTEKIVTPINFDTKREEYSGCFDQASEFLGLTFCGKVSVPWDGYRVLNPAYGPVIISAHIEKEDPTLNNFHFKAFYNIQKDAPQHHFEIVLDTPNSKKERRLGLVVENTIDPNLGFKATLDSPFGNAKLETSTVNSAAEKSINAELVLMDQEYVFKTGIKGTGPSKYKPFLVYKAPEGPKSRFAALSGAKQGQQTVSVAGDIDVEQHKLVFHGVKVTINRQDYVLDGSVWDEDKSTGADIKVTFSEDVLTIVAKSDTISPHHNKRVLQVASQKYPDVSISANWDLEFMSSKKHEKLKSDITLVHGPDPESATSRITLSNMYDAHYNPKGYPIKIKSKHLVTYPIVNMKGAVEFHGDENQIGYDVNASFENYNGGSSLQVELSPEYTVDFTSNLMEYNANLHMKRQSAGEDKSKFVNSLELNPGGKYQFNALVTHKFEPENIDAFIDAKITLPKDPKNIELKAGVKDNHDVHEGVLWASMDGNNVVDGKVAITKGKDIEGNFKFILPQYLDSHGKFKYGSTGADGNAVINLLKSNHKIEGKTHLVTNNPQFKGTADLCIDGKCIKLSSDSVISQESYETKNKLELPSGMAFGLNAKGEEPKGSHSAEAELNTPGGHHTKVSYASTRHMRPGDADVEYIVGLIDEAQSGGKPLSLEAKLVGKHIDLEKVTGDGQVIVTYQTPEDKDLSLHTNFKRAAAGDDKWICNTEFGVSGSLVTTPVTLKLESEVSEKYFSGDFDEDGSIPPINYHLKFDAGQELSVESHGKGAGHTTSNELHVNMPQSTKGIKNFKWTTNNMLDLLAVNSKLKTSNVMKWDGKFIKANAEVNEEDLGVNFNVDFESDSIPKKTLSGSAHYCDINDSGFCKADGSLDLTWDGKKADITIESEIDIHKNIGQVHAKGTTLTGTKFDFNTKTKFNNQGDHDVALHGETTLAIGDKKWAGTGTFEIDQNQHNINFILDHPDGQQSQFKTFNTKKGETHWSSDYAFKWITNGGGSLVGDMDINVESENNFNIKYNLDSPVMNLNKFHFEAKVTPDKTLALDMENNGKTIAAAKTSYQFTTEGTKKKVEGSGNINIEGKDYPLTYDATFDVKPEISSLLQMSVNAKAGDRTFTFNSEGKPHNFHMKRTYCKGAGDCSEAEIKYENIITDPLTYQQTFLYKLDFSLFNPDLKDMLISSKIKSEGLVYNHNLDIDWGDSKVHYVAFIQTNKAGVSLALPKRTLAAEASYGIPKKDKNALKLEGSVWLDKAKSPNKRSHLVIIGEVGQDKNMFTAQGEIKFNNPGLPKPLVVKGKTAISNSYVKPSGEGSFELDIFKKPKMKIVGNWKLTGRQTDDGFEVSNLFKVKSEELKLNAHLEQKAAVTKESATFLEKFNYVTAKGQNKELVTKTELTPNKFYSRVSSQDTVFLDYLAKWEFTGSSFAGTEDLEFLGEVYKGALDIKLNPLYVYYKFVNNQGCDSKELTALATFEMGKSTKLDFAFDGKSILVGEISLNGDTFLKPEAIFSKDTLKKAEECIHNSEVHAAHMAKDFLNANVPSIKEELGSKVELLAQGAVDWKGVAKMYSDEAEKIQDDIMSDKNLQGIAQITKETLSVFFENAVETFEAFHTTYKKTSEEISHTIQDLINSIKEIMPLVTKSLQELVTATVVLSNDLSKLMAELSISVLDEIVNNDEIAAVLKSISHICEDYGKMIYKYTHDINNDIEAFVKAIMSKLQDVPISDLINEQLDYIKPFFENAEHGFDQSMFGDWAQEVVGILDDILKQLKETKGFTNLEELLETIKTWIQKAIIDKEQVDNVDFAKKVAKELADIIKHIAEIIQEQMQIMYSDDPLAKAKLPTFSGLPLNRIPPGLLKLSGLSWLASSDLPSIVDVIATYLPAMNPDDWTPPFTARAYLLGGSEIITFDGAHISVGGDCNYVLTQDFLDGNFSVIGQFKGGHLEGIQVSDGHDTIELRHDKKPLVNGHESEFPIFQGELSAWKRAAVVGVKTKSGLKILCTPDCLRCKFKVDGLYFGRLRGLLGTYNYEQFDEFTLPSGEIVDSADKCLSAWAIGGCNAQSPKTSSKEATCTKTFTDAPEFMACYHLVSPKPYRDSCDSLAAKESTPEGLQAAVCNVAFAYSLQCQTRIPTAVPPSCLQCKKTKTDIFKTTEKVEPPFKKADVVFTIEKMGENKDVFENLIKPIIASIKSELSAKGISDIKFGLVGFGGKEHIWPAYYTNHGKILSEDIEAGNLSFDPVVEKNDVGNFLDNVVSESGVTGKSMTYMDLVEFYPWRIGTSKVVVGIHSSPCKKSHALFLLQHLYYISSYLNKGITFHTVSPVEDLELPGKDSKKILAIGSDEIFTTDDASKKPMAGHGDKSAEDAIKYQSDVCFTFAHMTGGYVFPAENYLQGGAGEKDSFKKGLTTAVVESLTDQQKQLPQTCSCHPKANPYDGIFSQSDCRIINI